MSPSFVRFGLGLGLVMMASGCFVTGSEGHFRASGLEKAAFDMQCPKEKLEVTKLAPGSFGVTGCGKQTRYEYLAGNASWVLNAANDKPQ